MSIRAENQLEDSFLKMCSMER